MSSDLRTYPKIYDKDTILPNSYFELIKLINERNINEDTDLDIFALDFKSDLENCIKELFEFINENINELSNVSDEELIKMFIEISNSIQEEYARIFKILIFSVLFKMYMISKYQFKISENNELNQEINLRILFEIISISIFRNEYLIDFNLYQYLFDNYIQLNKTLFSQYLYITESGKYFIWEVSKNHYIICNCEEYILSEGEDVDSAIDNIELEEQYEYYKSHKNEFLTNPDYKGKFVAIRKKEIIGCNSNNFDLADNVCEKYPDDVVLIIKVEKELPIFENPSVESA